MTELIKKLLIKSGLDTECMNDGKPVAAIEEYTKLLLKNVNSRLNRLRYEAEFNDDIGINIGINKCIDKIRSILK